MNITLKDGSVKVYDAPVSAADVCKDLSMGLYRAACCCKINGEVKDLRTVMDNDASLEILTFDDLDGKKTFWHSASHLLAQAVKRLFPEAKLAPPSTAASTTISTWRSPSPPKIWLPWKRK